MKISKKFLLRIAIIGSVILVINIFFYQLCFVNGKSMFPTLKHGDLVCIKKYDLKLKHNDIVVINKNGKIIIKRLIGLPGDLIKINDYVYVNGKRNDDLYIQNCGTIKEEVYLKDNEYFVLGDNRQNSIDSRFQQIGIINKNEIKGKIILGGEK